MAWIFIYVGITLIAISLLVLVLSHKFTREVLILFLQFPFWLIYKVFTVVGSYIIKIPERYMNARKANKIVRAWKKEKKEKLKLIEKQKKVQTSIEELSESEIRSIQKRGLRYRD